MTKSALLAAVSIFAFWTGGSFAAQLPMAPASGKFNSFLMLKGAKLLYSQNSNDAGNFIDSQNFTSDFSPTYNNQGADDFVVPKGSAWTISEIDVTGAYFNGSGPAISENIIFYKDKKSEPGIPVKNGSFKNLNGSGGPNFVIKLPRKGIELRAGKYWVSVIANIGFDGGGQWGWEVNGAQHGNEAMWQNPDNGFGTDCITWKTIESCLARGPDLMFALQGTSKRTESTQVQTGVLAR
jgi:hypothetical protein